MLSLLGCSCLKNYIIKSLQITYIAAHNIAALNFKKKVESCVATLRINAAMSLTKKYQYQNPPTEKESEGSVGDLIYPPLKVVSVDL